LARVATVMTIEGARGSRRKRSSGKKNCKRVRMGKRSGCTIELCKVGNRWKFQKGTSRCGG
jgi:hypothetical protein